MFKKFLKDHQMSHAALLDPHEIVDQAEHWSKELTRMRARGPGDVENAMRSIERDYGVDYWVLWRLRYRRDQVKDVWASAFNRLCAAYQIECARQQRKLSDDLKATRKIAGADHPAVVAAAAVVGADDGEED